MDSLPTRPKEGKKMNPIGPKVSELTIGGGVLEVLFLLDAIRCDLKERFF